MPWISQFEPIKQVVSYELIQKTPELSNLLPSRSIQPPKFTQLASHGLYFQYFLIFFIPGVGEDPFQSQRYGFFRS